jgi:hypothetical protein
MNFSSFLCALGVLCGQILSAAVFVFEFIIVFHGDDLVGFFQIEGDWFLFAQKTLVWDGELINLLWFLGGVEAAY